MYQCFAWNQFYSQKNKFEIHLKVCSIMAGIVYKFENQNIDPFEENLKNMGDLPEENLKNMGDLPFAAYFDFETTISTTSQNYLEDEVMYSNSYSVIFVFHPNLQFDRIVIEASTIP